MFFYRMKKEGGPLDRAGEGKGVPQTWGGSVSKWTVDEYRVGIPSPSAYEICPAAQIQEQKGDECVAD
jgi:hypothetical protein